MESAMSSVPVAEHYWLFLLAASLLIPVGIAVALTAPWVAEGPRQRRLTAYGAGVVTVGMLAAVVGVTLLAVAHRGV
jgi:hypothetical protein